MKTTVYLNFLCLILLATSLNVKLFTKDILEQFKHYPDYIHHFVFFNRPTLDAIQADLQTWGNQHDIYFYINDCKGNKLPQCETPEDSPLLLIYNRVLIKYNSHPTNLQHMREWIESRIVKNTQVVNNAEELNSLISKTPNVYCFCANDKNQDDQATFIALAKSLPFLNYCILRNQIHYTQLGLKTGNLTYIKNETSNRVEYIYPNRLDSWQWFVKSNMLHLLPRAQSLAMQRFQQKQKNLDVYALTCDLSFTCEKVWEQVRDIQHQLTKQNLGYEFYIALQDQKESFTFNLYFHVTFNMSSLPAFVHINLVSAGEAAGDLVRHIQYTSSEFSKEKLQNFKEEVEKGQVQPFYFSDQVPKKKGFTGKGSQRFIQKLVASNILQEITSSLNHYILLISALDIGCSQCETFYKDFKQIASLLKDKDVTFGFLNVNKNEVSLQQVSKLPEVLLFKKDDKANPIRLEVTHIFDHLRNFIRKHLGDSYADPDEL